jgi:hypothetical protein
VLFQISRNTIDLWLKRKAATGCLEPTARVGSPAQGKIQNWEAFRAFATFHHGGRIVQLIEAAGCQVVYLPPYFPDLNRIEKCWGWLKSRLRKHLPHADGLRAAIEAVLKQAAS